MSEHGKAAQAVADSILKDRAGVNAPDAPPPMGVLEIIGWISDALQEQELEDDSTTMLEGLIAALRVRGVQARGSAPAGSAPNGTLATDEEVQEARAIFRDREAMGDPYVWHRVLENFVRRRLAPHTPSHLPWSERCPECGVVFFTNEPPSSGDAPRKERP